MHPKQASLLKTAQRLAEACGCQGPAMGADPHSEGIRVVWEDPTSYDAKVHGPPYLPGGRGKLGSSERKQVREWVKQASAGKTSSGLGLAGLLGCLRAAAWLHQTHHWQTAGTSFYADHLLFDRLYNDSLPLIDRLAERTVGNGIPVTAGEQSQILSSSLAEVSVADGANAMVESSLVMELKLLSHLDSVYAALQSQSALSQGTDNLLQEIADKHEEFTYLLKQRSQQA